MLSFLPQPFGELLTALFIGALVGVDRERRLDLPGAQAFGGLRTFILIAQLGAVCGWLSAGYGMTWLLPAGLVGLTALLLGSYAIAARAPGPPPGVTSEVAGLVVYLLGALTTLGQAELAVVLAVATSALLAFRAPLHRLVRALSEDDVAAGLKLLFATTIVLPLLPDHAIDPWGALNPSRLWLLVIFISGLSLVGYVAMRKLGARRGLALTGLTGGLASSTAVTLSFARRSAELPALGDALAIGVLASWVVMFVRVAVEVSLVNPALLVRLLPPLAGMALAAGLTLLLVWRHRGTEGALPEELTVRNPFSLSAAVGFGAVYAAVLLAVQLTRTLLGTEWLYGVALLAGTTDVDAITLSLAQHAGAGLPEAVAVRAILLACLSNTAVKCGLVLGLGRGPLRRHVLVATTLAGAALALSVAWGQLSP